MLLVIGILIAISIGGLVEVVPLFYLKNTIEKVDGVRPYSPLELAGCDIYVREGCYLCHSQMIRPCATRSSATAIIRSPPRACTTIRFNGDRSERPDLARVGGKYSDDWHRDHLRDPRAVVPGSIMPGYGFLAQTDLDYAHIAENLKVQALLGVPYTPEMIAHAQQDVLTQDTNDSPDAADLAKRYPKVHARIFAGVAGRVTEADALIAYLQRLGTADGLQTL